MMMSTLASESRSKPYFRPRIIQFPS